LVCNFAICLFVSLDAVNIKNIKRNPMKNIKLIYLAAGLMAISAPQLTRGEDTKPATPPNREELREKLKNMTPEEREAKMKEFRAKNPEAAANLEKRGEEMKKFGKELGLDAEEMQKLSQEERREKFKAAIEKKTAELEKKKAADTLTAEDKELLKHIEERKKMMEGGRRGEGGPGPGRKPGAKPADKPADK
jgi:hypothetical protein